MADDYLTDDDLHEILKRTRDAIGSKWTVVVDRKPGDPEEIVGLPRHVLHQLVRELFAARSLVGGLNGIVYGMEEGTVNLDGLRRKLRRGRVVARGRRRVARP